MVVTEAYITNEQDVAISKLKATFLKFARLVIECGETQGVLCYTQISLKLFKLQDDLSRYIKNANQIGYVVRDVGTGKIYTGDLPDEVRMTVRLIYDTVTMYKLYDDITLQNILELELIGENELVISKMKEIHSLLMNEIPSILNDNILKEYLKVS